MLSGSATSNEVLARLDGDAPCDRVVDFLLRTGPQGEGFGLRPDGLSLARLRAHPHGLDFGAWRRNCRAC